MPKNNSPLVLILAGGSGTRLWPLSRQAKPKQLLALYSHKSLIRETYERALLLTDKKSIFIGTSKKYRKAIAQELKIKNRQFILEPQAKNTAPIIALFAKKMSQKKKNQERPLVILSADHFIANVESWRQAIQEACASQQYLVCLGIKPSRAETDYGYIEVGETISGSLKNILSFKEKPDANTALHYLNSENYYWNSGMFIFPLKLFLTELKRHAPQIDELTNLALQSKKKLKESFAQMPDISIDYALLEKSDKLAVIAANFSWDDVGSFEAAVRILPPDSMGNYVLPPTHYHGLKSHNNIIYSAKPVALLGIKNLVIIETQDILLLAERSYLPEIKKLRAEFPQYW